MENLIKSLNNILNGFYSVTENSDGTFQIQTEYNNSLISYQRGIVKFLAVTRNK